MESINSQLKALFKRWKEKSPSEYFIEDGLMMTPGRNSNETEIEWKQSNLRIAFLVKDNNQECDEEGSDSSTTCWFTKHPNLLDLKSDPPYRPTFFKNIANLLYGFSHTPKTAPSYENTKSHLDEVKKCLREMPFAIIESKKQPGGSKISDKELKQNLEKYGTKELKETGFLKQELLILKPNIVVCMGGPIFEFLKEEFSEDGVEPVILNSCGFPHIFYVKKFNMIIMPSYHPSWWVYNKVYDGVFNWYNEFLKTEYARMIFQNN